jgi:hypothetical protein
VRRSASLGRALTTAAVRQMFSSLALFNYRLYFWGQLVSQIGSWMQRAGTAWLVLEISNSPAALGMVTALQFIPSLVLGCMRGCWAIAGPNAAC